MKQASLSEEDQFDRAEDGSGVIDEEEYGLERNLGGE
jgi:hypothetical protein